MSPLKGLAMAQRVCVTGASGQAGRAVVADLREHGYDVTPTDVAVSRADREDGMLQANLTDYGQAVEFLPLPTSLADMPGQHRLIAHQSHFTIGKALRHVNIGAAALKVIAGDACGMHHRCSHKKKEKKY